MRRGSCILGSDFIVAEDEIGEDLSELSGDIWRDEGIHGEVVANTAPHSTLFGGGRSGGAAVHSDLAVVSFQFCN